MACHFRVIKRKKVACLKNMGTLIKRTVVYDIDIIMALTLQPQLNEDM